MLEGLDRIDWASMSHAYGGAADVPAMLRGLVSRSPEEREQALDSMLGAVHHQGDVYECTVAAVPFLLEILSHPELPGRADVASLLASIGGAPEVGDNVREEAGPAGDEATGLSESHEVLEDENLLRDCREALVRMGAE